MQSHIKFPFYAKASLICIGFFALISMLFLAQRIIVPIIYSTIIAIVLSPIVNFFVRKKINRILSITITVLLVISLTFLIIALLSSQMIQFSDSFPKLIDKFHQLIEQSIAWTSSNFNISTVKINLWITEKNAELLSGTSSLIGQTLINTGSVLIVMVLIPVYVFMILYYQPLLLEFIHKLFKTADQTEVNEVLIATKKIIRSYLIGLLLEALIIATLNSTALLVLGIDYAILLGVIGAIVNVIPYIGGIVAVVLPMMIAFATKSSFSYCLMVLMAYIIIQFVDNHYIIPKVVASKVKINALISIIVVLAGGALWGFPGMFLSIPLTAIVKVVFDHIKPLKPWGYLLGDTMPTTLELKSPIQKTINNQI
jgi:predicted PurR-regulated permease PerM